MANKHLKRHCLLICVAALQAASLFPQDKPSELSPQELVRKAVAHEVAANNSPVKHIFSSRKQTPKGSQTRLYVETNDAMAGMLIAVNDQPLTEQQQQAETDHLAWLTNNPDQLRKKHQREKEDAERTLRIVKALPDAFLYESAGTERRSRQSWPPKRCADQAEVQAKSRIFSAFARGAGVTGDAGISADRCDGTPHRQD